MRIGNLFHKQQASENISETPAGGGRWVKFVRPAITVVILSVVAVFLIWGAQDPPIMVLDGVLTIEGMYGLPVEFSQISDVSLLEQSMREIGPGRRTNGYGGFGQTLKGNFESDSLGKTLLFVQQNTAPTIKIERGAERTIYISLRSGEETRALYTRLAEALAAAES